MTEELTPADVATLDSLCEMLRDTIDACIELSVPLHRVSRRLATEDAVDVFPGLDESEAVAMAQALILASMMIRINELNALCRIEKEGRTDGSK